MPFPEIHGNVALHGGLVPVKGLVVSLAHRGRHPEGDMDELLHPGIVAPVGLHVAEGGDFIKAVISRAVDLFGHGQTVPAGVREADDLLEPGRAGGLQVKDLPPLCG